MKLIGTLGTGRKLQVLIAALVALLLIEIGRAHV